MLSCFPSRSSLLCLEKQYRYHPTFPKRITNGHPSIEDIFSKRNRIKGLSYAIRALYELMRTDKRRDYLFIIIGEGEEHERLCKLAQDLGVGENVIFTGHKNNACRYLRAFDIFVLPSIKEGLPYVILEAGAAKLSVVATNTGGIPEMIKDMETGVLVRTENVHEISKAYEFLAANDAKRKELGSQLHKLTTEKFSLDSMVENTKKVYYSA